MVSPTPVNPLWPGSTGQTTPESAHGMTVGSPARASATRRFLDTFGFHLLVVLLGIALAFM